MGRCTLHDLGPQPRTKRLRHDIRPASRLQPRPARRDREPGPGPADGAQDYPERGPARRNRGRRRTRADGGDLDADGHFSASRSSSSCFRQCTWRRGSPAPGYLLYLAYRIWRDASAPVEARGEPARHAFRQGFLVNLLNPKSVLFAGRRPRCRLPGRNRYAGEPRDRRKPLSDRGRVLQPRSPSASAPGRLPHATCRPRRTSIASQRRFSVRSGCGCSSAARKPLEPFKASRLAAPSHVPTHTDPAHYCEPRLALPLGASTPPAPDSRRRPLVVVPGVRGSVPAPPPDPERPRPRALRLQQLVPVHPRHTPGNFTSGSPRTPFRELPRAPGILRQWLPTRLHGGGTRSRPRCCEGVGRGLTALQVSTRGVIRTPRRGCLLLPRWCESRPFSPASVLPDTPIKR